MAIQVTGGALRGRKLRSPQGDRIRPTAARVRESLFSILGQNLEGWRVLDLFAGAGTLGIEAGSRGASHVVFVEQDRVHARLLTENAALLDGIAQHRVITRTAAWATEQLAREGRPFNLVLMDPPYGRGLAARSLAQLAAAGDAILSTGATVVVEGDAREPLPDNLGDGWASADRRNYGHTAITLYRRGAS